MEVAVTYLIGAGVVLVIAVLVAMWLMAENMRGDGE